jgi:NAD(P)H-hydrate epimerase
MPSGVDSDTGQTPGDAVRATGTLTLGGLKPGLLFAPGVTLAGRVDVHGIGIPRDLRDARAQALEEDDVRRLLPRREPGTHKRAVGTLLVVAGSRAMPGAAALVCGASVHGGAGLTTLAAPEEVCRVVLSRVPEITTIPLPETAEGTFNEKALDLIRPRLEEFHAIALGPGLSTHPDTRDAVRMIVSEARLPAVIDADGITAFVGATDLLSERRSHVTVITPHAGELARLMGRDSKNIEADRLSAAREAASALRSVVLLKGPGTVVAENSGFAFVNATGSAALAQGGTGDVLTGLLGALLAQFMARPGAQRFAGLPVIAAIAAWIHGAAGDLAAERVAPHPANASLLIDLLPEVLHRLA